MIPNPISPYAKTKLTAEEHCEFYTYYFNLPTVCLRYFNDYGRDQKLGTVVVPLFIHKAKAGMPLVIYGDGGQRRDYIYIDDVVNATVHAAESDMQGVYNVGSGRSVTVNRLASIIIGATGSRSPISHTEPREGDPQCTCADISKLAGAGFKPKWTLEEGLEKCIVKA